MILFDMDGTLTPSRGVISEDMFNAISTLDGKGEELGLITGSDMPKIREQLGDNTLSSFTYIMAENGAHRVVRGVESQDENVVVSDALIDEITLTLSRYYPYPATGPQIEIRSSTVNISPPGRGSSSEARLAFSLIDDVHHYRYLIANSLSDKFPTLQFSIGGKTSIDVFPRGRDKTYALQFIPLEDKALFIGDRGAIGGNDYEIMNHPDIAPHHVTSPEDTLEFLKGLE